MLKQFPIRRRGQAGDYGTNFFGPTKFSRSLRAAIVSTILTLLNVHTVAAFDNVVSYHECFTSLTDCDTSYGGQLPPFGSTFQWTTANSLVLNPATVPPWAHASSDYASTTHAAQGKPGAIGVSVSTQLYEAGYVPPYFNATTVDGNTDEVTITAPGQTGVGYLAVSLELKGSITGTAFPLPSNAWLPSYTNYYYFYVGGPTTNSSLITTIIVPNSSASPDVSFDRFYLDTHPIKFQYGVPFTLVFDLGAGLTIGCVETYAVEQCVTDSATDLRDTASIVGFAVTNADGQPIDDFTAIGSSGARYTPSGVLYSAVPEPFPVAFVSAGLGVLIFSVRRRRSFARDRVKE